LRNYAICLYTKKVEGFAAYSDWAYRSHKPKPPSFVRVFSGLLPDHRELSDCEAEEWIAFPTPSQRVEQIDCTLPAFEITQNDQWTAVKVPSNCGVVYNR